ncbi:MAG TPA: SprT family zinc-dependent metalloprotease [Candidatus Saccharimonadales bacterium]|nr:SprT family zinc-dependent metalloprotease [Candidatus Saccharimonadales bacterium]
MSETPVVASLPGGALPFTLRRSPRARTIRVVIHPDHRGVVVTVPGGRVGAAEGERRAIDFLHDREPWLRRHLARQAETRARVAARGGARDGGTVPFLGRLHGVRVVPAVVGQRRSSIAAFSALDGDEDELVIHRVDRERRADAAVLEAWLRERALEAIQDAITDHADALRVVPTTVTLRDPRGRWGSASRHGRLSFSWRLILAPPAALETVVIHELAHLRYFGHGPTFWALVATRRPDHATWRRWLHDHSADLHAALEPPDPVA